MQDDLMSDNPLLKDRTCEVCGCPELLLGVASSALGPMSQMICSVCAAMSAEQEWMIDFIFEEKNFRAQAGEEAFIFYDKESGSYINYGTRNVELIKLNNGMEFNTRKEYIEHLKKEIKKQNDERRDKESN